MGILLSTRRVLLGESIGWTPDDATPGGYYPEHWYRSDQGLWQDAGVTPATSDGDVVGRWEDLTANADHVNQAVVANKPTLQNGAGDLLNGYPVVRSDGINDYLRGAFTTGGAIAQPFTGFIVAALAAAAVNDNVLRVLVDDDNTAGAFAQGANNSTAPDTWYMQGIATVNPTTADWLIWTSLWNGAASQFWLNGVNQAVGNAGVNALSGLTIEASAASTSMWKGDCAEILVYSANLSNADKNTVGQYLATRYALAYTNI